MIDKIDIPVSNSQLTHFLQSENIMDYYITQQYLNELVGAGYLEQSRDNNITRYALTEDGSVVLEAFTKQIPQSTKNIIMKYVTENRKAIKQDFETAATYFYNHETNEYIVKCIAHEDEIMLMELNMSVVSREQALKICNNWKRNIAGIYGKVINLLLSENHEKRED